MATAALAADLLDKLLLEALLVIDFLVDVDGLEEATLFSDKLLLLLASLANGTSVLLSPV